MTAELIYKTSSPRAIEWWNNVVEKHRADQAARRAYEERMTEEFGKPELPDYFPESRRECRRLWLRGEFPFALDSGYNERPPEGSGWRLDSKDHNWQPKLATKEGKARLAELNALTTYDMRSHLHEIGVAPVAFAASHLYRPGVQFDEDEGVLYVTWGSGRCAAEAKAAQDKVPDVVWVEVKRSEWYAREERIAAEKEEGER